MSEVVPEPSWTRVLRGNKVNQAGFGLTGSKQVSSAMLALLRLLNSICFVLKDQQWRRKER